MTTEAKSDLMRPRRSIASAAVLAILLTVAAPALLVLAFTGELARLATWWSDPAVALWVTFSVLLFVVALVSAATAWWRGDAVSELAWRRCRRALVSLGLIGPFPFAALAGAFFLIQAIRAGRQALDVHDRFVGGIAVVAAMLCLWSWPFYVALFLCHRKVEAFEQPTKPKTQ